MCIEYKSTRKTSHVTGKSDNTKEIILINMENMKKNYGMYSNDNHGNINFKYCRNNLL